MKKTRKIPHFEILESIPSDLKELARLEQKSADLSMCYMEARELVLSKFGWDSSYHFDQWYKNQKRSLHSIQNSPNRKRCIVNIEPDYPDGVYIFELPIQIVSSVNTVVHILTNSSCSEPISVKSICDFEWIIEDDENDEDDLTTNLHFNIAPSTYQKITRCNMWVKDIKMIERTLEQRTPSGTCNAKWAYDYAQYSEQDLYLITTTEDFHSWATLWGGMAIMTDDFRKELNETDRLVKSIFSDYLAKRVYP